MYDRLLFPNDGSETAASAFEYALEIASEHDATIHVLTVIDTTEEDITRIGEEAIDALEGEGERIVHDAAEQAAERGVSVVPESRHGTPHETIVDYSEEVDIDLIVMPNHGRADLERYLLGSVTERVLNTASVPVLTVNPDANDALTYPVHDVLVPTDGSRGANRALTEGIDLANATGATLHLLHVVETAKFGFDIESEAVAERLEGQANEIVTEAIETVNAAAVGSVTSSIAHGQPYREISSYVEANDIDLVAIGTHGRTDFSRYTLGGVSSKIVRTASVPVLMVREPTADEPDGSRESGHR